MMENVLFGNTFFENTLLNMVTVSSLTMMAPGIKVSGIMASITAMAHFEMQMAIFLKENFKLGKKLQDPSLFQKGQFMMESLRMIYDMERALRLIKMDISMQKNGMMVCDRDMEFALGLMEQFTRVNGVRTILKVLA